MVQRKLVSLPSFYVFCLGRCFNEVKANHCGNSIAVTSLLSLVEFVEVLPTSGDRLSIQVKPNTGWGSVIVAVADGAWFSRRRE